MPDLGPLTAERKTGNELLHRDGTAVGYTLIEFWQWSTSDLLNNTTRGKLAEYIVARDLGIVDGVRAEWEPYDLLATNGIKVEVKSAAYLQSWHQDRLSTISFGIAATRAWSSATNTYSEEKKRQADVYVFCLLDETNKRLVDPLNVNQWLFFVLLTSRLDAEVGDQDRIGLSKLRDLGPAEVRFGEIRSTIGTL